MKFLRDISPVELLNKRVLVRVDFNISLIDGVVGSQEAFRIDRTIPTIKYLLDAGASVVLISHIGRGGESLRPAFDYLVTRIEKCSFVPDLVGEEAKRGYSHFGLGEVWFFENFGKIPGKEETKGPFAKELVW